MRKRDTIEVRIQAVRMYQKGYSAEHVSRELDVKGHYIREWVERYRMYGIEGLRRRSQQGLGFDEKSKIIFEYRENGVPLHIVSARYRVSQSTISRWAKMVADGGYDALRAVRRKGRPPKDMGRPRKKEPETELEKLRAENERLRTENALLKKVQALVAERIAREEGSGRKPSSR